MPLDATPTTYVQCDENNNNMADKQNFEVGATISLLNRRLWKSGWQYTFEKQEAFIVEIFCGKQ
jgi:hypothetical protein